MKLLKKRKLKKLQRQRESDWQRKCMKLLKKRKLKKLQRQRESD
jgi:hypothetical protein